ncbi:MAG: DEAD/DEAH box helicase, partial [Anaerolineales bacterium]|nr:DEAD/DEAH box helicase [Anaerolineales bacterium]
SVIHHWERELNRFYPRIRVYPYHGPGRRRQLLQALEPIVFVTTYATATNDVAELSKVPFLYLVLDEATSIKNPDTKRTQAVKALNAAHRLALSGTPVENRPAELWSIFDFLMRGHLGKYGTFVRLFEERIGAGDRAASEKLGRRIRPFLLRRTKDEVARDLPDKIEMDEWCGLSPEQEQLYGALQETVKQLRTALQRGEQVSYTTNILPVLTKLKQICDHPALVSGEKVKEPGHGRSEKFDWIVAKIDEIHASGEQVVVFSHFLGMLDLLETVLRRKGMSYIRIDGSTTRRQAVIDRFNAGQAGVAICSVQAAGYGINMTAANHVIHADRWWNPAVEDQATDRVHRIGQDKTVYVYRIMVEGTLEERIDRLLMRKRGMADQIVRAAVGDSDRGWTRDELLELLRPLD